MPTITVSDATYAKMKAAAEPFIDTEDSVTSRALDVLLERNGISTNGNGHAVPPDDKAVRLTPDSHELAHTKLISATVDGRVLLRPNWNSLMNDMHIKARQRLGSYEAVRKASAANLRQGRYEKSGYKYLPDADMSIQGVDANLACQHSFRLAKAMNIPLSVMFEWRDKEDAAHPGQRGVIEWTPNGH